MRTSLLLALALSPAPAFAQLSSWTGSEAHAAVDADKNGSLDAVEIVRAAVKSAAAPGGKTELQRAKHALKEAVQADSDKDGKVSAKEWAAHHDAHSGEPARVAGAKHASADADGDGALTRAELEKDAAKLPGKKETRDALVAEAMKADADKDGKITATEYKAWHAPAQEKK